MRTGDVKDVLLVFLHCKSITVLFVVLKPTITFITHFIYYRQPWKFRFIPLILSVNDQSHYTSEIN